MTKDNENMEDDYTFDEEGEVGADVIKKLRAKLKQVEADKQEYLDGWQRAKADYINLRTTEEKAKSDLGKHIQIGFINDLLPLADTFEMAFANKDAWESVNENWRRGVEYIYAQLQNILNSYGVKEVNPLGDEFDPTFHHSIGTVEVEDASKDNKVIEVLKKGYIAGETLVRPAQVKVGIAKN